LARNLNTLEQFQVTLLGDSSHFEFILPAGNFEIFTFLQDFSTSTVFLFFFFFFFFSFFFFYQFNYD